MEIFFLQQIKIMFWLQNHVFQIISSEVLIFFARYLAWIFLGLLIIFLMKEIIIHFYQREYIHTRKVIYSILFSGSIAFLIQAIAKNFIIAKRPFLAGISSLYEYGMYDSFPSGHALVFMTLAITVFYFHKTWGYFFIVLASIIGISRIIVGIHWPLDIITGWVISFFVAYGSVQFIKKITRN